ncbi:MAG: hypothetical protein ACFFB2_00210 [Promethearchaeota archaeon]
MDVSTDANKHEKEILVIKFNSTEFVVFITQIDGIAEFDDRFKKNENVDLWLGKYYNQTKIIPVLNLKKYLHCPKVVFIPTLQSRILFLSYSAGISPSSDSLIIGVGIDSITGFFPSTAFEGKIDMGNILSPELKCFKIHSYIQINTKKYPYLDLKKLLDFSSLKSILEQLKTENI